MKLQNFYIGLIALALLFPLSARSQQPGKFDYYLLSLSWSPEYCFSHRSAPECSQHLGLVVHGLWPQYNGAGRGPENCGHQPGPADPSSYSDMFPSASLVEHEWNTHGTCSGLSATDYFALIRRVFSSFHAPPELQHPTRQIIIRASDLKRSIEQHNPGLNDSEIAFSCTGFYLKEVQVCLTKDGKPQPCSSLRQCPSSSLHIPAVR